MAQPQLSLLHIEDDSLDAEAFRRALRRHQLEADVCVATDGTEALQKLRDPSRVSGDDELVLLDLNMPGMNGHEFLDELRADPSLRTKTVFVLSSSDHARDMQLAYERNVAGYFLKSDLDSLIATLTQYTKDFAHPATTA